MGPRGLRAGVYVDVENIARNGGRGMRFDTLRQYATRDGADAIRLNAYLAFDEDRGQRDLDYRSRATRYHFALRDVGFKVIEKPVQWYTNEDGVRVSRANSDLDLAVDMLLQSAKLDRVVLVSGDAAFVQVVRALQNHGCRVELIGFQHVSYDLRCESDVFISGYLIPGLLPTAVKNAAAAAAPVRPPAWGEAGSHVRGTCYHFNVEKGFGFLRYLGRLGDLTITDTRDAESPYREAFFHRSQCPANLDLGLLPNRDMVFDFVLVPGREGKMEANELSLVVDYAAQQRPAPASDSRPGRGSGSRPAVPPDVAEADRTASTPTQWGRTGLDEPRAATPPGGR
jgi:uncharacterized LabA/DUF88 family protein/cold shock CspA family protein